MTQIDLHSLLTMLSTVTFAVLGIELCFKRIPSEKEFSKLNTGRWMLASAFLLLTVFSSLELFLRDGQHIETTIFFTVAAAAYQSILFFSALLTCINPAFAENNRLRLWIGITSTWVTVCGILFAFGIDWIVYVELVIYVLQIAYSSYKFHEKLQESLTLIAVTDSRHNIHTNWGGWLKFSYFAIIFFSLLTAVFAWAPAILHNIFTVLCVIFYIWFTSNFSIYTSRIFQKYYPVLTEAGLTETDPQTFESVREKEQQCKAKVDSWVANKGFCNPDPDRDSAAKHIGLDKADLQWYFSVCVKEEFRAWRVKLRIEEAKSTLLMNPNTQINELAKALGFISKTNFYAHFKRITGETTSEFISRNHHS